jgi:nitrogen regulatory protein PII
MQLLVIVLSEIEKLDTLLDDLLKNGFTGATILNSTGMVREVGKNIDSYPLFGSLRYMIDLDRDESKTIFMILKDEQVEAAKKIVRDSVGDLSKPDTAILFTLPVSSAEGVRF